MSHIAQIELEIHDLDSLEKAANACGLELVRDQKTYRWFGRSVGDYPLPQGFTEQDLGKCTHALRIPGDSHAYEIGVVQKPDGSYTLLWDFWQGGYGLQAKVGENAHKLQQQYAVARTKKSLAAKGWRNLRVSEDADGTLHVRGDK